MIDWEIYNGAEADGVNGVEDLASSNMVDVATEIAAMDKSFAKKLFAGKQIAGQEIKYSFNRYGSLTARVAGHKAKGQLMKAIIECIYEDHFIPTKVEKLNEKWEVIHGVNDLFNKTKEIKFLLRADKVISCLKPKAKVIKTVKFYEQAVYKSTAWENLQTGNIRDFKPEFHLEDDVYSKQEPEFTREDELEEIYQFISSLKGRRRSAEEQLLLMDIAAEINSML
jgi:hypothetical protein